VAKFPKTLVLSWSVPPAASGMGTVMHNLLSQFTANEMVAVGAYYVGHSGSKWSKEKPRILFGMLNPPEYWRGHRWILLLQLPLLIIVSVWALLFFGCKAIFVVYPNQLFLFTGYLLSRIFKKPLYVYFHNTYLEDSQDSRFAHWLQPRVFEHARHTFVMSEGLLAYYKKLYPQLKCSALIHTTMVYPKNTNINLPPVHTPVRLVFAGSVNASCADAMGRFIKLIKSDSGYYLNIYSGMHRETFRQMGFLLDNMSITNVPYDQLLGCLQNSDIVIHPHGFTGSMAAHEYETIFPTKTLEYLLSGRPILAHLPRNCSLANFYTSHDCALQIHEPSVEALRDGLMQICNDANLRKKLVTNALEAARLYYAPKVIDHMRKIMREDI